MSWNWEVFLKSWLFGFLGFLLGIVSTVIYLAVDVDLSKLDGTLMATIILAFATVTLVIVSNKYAKSTEKMLDDQRKSRQIAEIDKKLEMFYQPLENLFEISTKRQYVKVIGRAVDLKPDAITLFEENNVYSYLYLACDEVKEFLQMIMTGLLPEDMDAKVFFKMYDDIEDIVTNEISELKDERTKLLG